MKIYENLWKFSVVSIQIFSSTTVTASFDLSVETMLQNVVF